MKFQTTNYEGDLAFTLPPDLELYSKVCTTAMGGEFYIPDTNDLLNSIKTLVRKNDPKFVAQLAVYARESMYLRAIPLVLAVELAKQHKGDDIVRRMARRVIGRADELAQILVYYAKSNKSNWETNKETGVLKTLGKLSNQLRLGIADAFSKFDEYQFAKYDRTYLIDKTIKDPVNNNIKLRDVLFLTHPKPQNQGQADLFNLIAQDQLAKADTWEKRMTESKKDERSKKEVWEGLIDDKRMGYMACLRNLRNFIQEDVSIEHIEKVAEYLANPKAVRKSRQLPFRYLSAYRAIGFGKEYRRQRYWDQQMDDFGLKPATKKHEILAIALEKAVLTSIENIPMFDREKVLIAADVSSSMQVPATGTRDDHWRMRQEGSNTDIVERYDIGILLSLMLESRCEYAVTGMFGDTWKPIQMPSRDILAKTNKMHGREGEVGYSTNGYKVIEWALSQLKRGKPGFDRIMMFTDGQMWDDTYSQMGRIEKLWREYKGLVTHSKLYLFNLAPYGTSPVNLGPGDVYMISGWSEKVFEVLRNIEAGDEALDTIKEIVL